MNKELNQNQKLAALEALLFIHGEPLVFKKIQKILAVDEKALEEVLTEFEKALANEGRGLALIRDHEKVQLATKPEWSGIAEEFVKSELSEDLSPASLEVVSIITYFGPISRSRLEHIRGVNSSFTLRSLLLRGLIERFPDPAHHHIYLYQPTFELLKYLGLGKKEDLPDYGKFKDLMQKLEQFNAVQPDEPAGRADEEICSVKQEDELGDAKENPE